LQPVHHSELNWTVSALRPLSIRVQRTGGLAARRGASIIESHNP